MNKPSLVTRSCDQAIISKDSFILLLLNNTKS